MRVVQLVSGLMYGGGQRVALDLRREIQSQQGVQIQLWLLGCRSGMEEVKPDQIVPYDGRYNRPWVRWQCAWRLRRMLRTHAIDILHTHGWDADWIGSMACGNNKVRHVLHLHVLAEWLDSRRLRHHLRRRVARRLLQRAHRVLAVSRAVRSRWCRAIGFSELQINVIANGIDSEKFHPPARPPIASGHLTFGMATRLVSGKGLEDMLDALAQVRASGADLRLRIAGHGPLAASLKQRARDLGLDEAVAWLGQVEDMAHFYRGIDGFVQASLSEGMPLALLEAMATGLPCIATDVGGTAEVMDDGCQGRLVPAGNSVVLAQAMMELFGDVDARRRMADAARGRVMAFHSLRQMAASVLQSYPAWS